MGWDGKSHPPDSLSVAGSIPHEPQPSRVRKMGLIRSRQMVVMAKTATPGAVPNTDRYVSLGRQTSVNMAYSCSAASSDQGTSKRFSPFARYRAQEPVLAAAQ